MNEAMIESIVKDVIKELKGNIPASSANGRTPGTARTAVLAGERNIQIQEFPIPQLKEGEILVKVEGCGVCGTDVHEWKGDPFGLIPLILGHEGTGEVVAMGSGEIKDTSGKQVQMGDKLVTSVIACGKCAMCRNHPERPNLCEEAGIYGLFPNPSELNGWFADYIVIRNQSTFYVVNELSLDQRMLLELASVTIHALERSKTTGIIDFNSKVLVQGCGPVGLMMIAVLKAYGVRDIIALDGTPNRLEMAKRLGAVKTINFKEVTELDSRINIIKEMNDGMGADFAFQCTGVPPAAAEIWKYVRRGGGLCEVGFFVNNGDCKINPHFDICNKEITVVGSWTYGALEYKLTIAFLKTAKEIGLPLEDLITHRYGLTQLNEAMEKNLSLEGIKIAYVSAP